MRALFEQRLLPLASGVDAAFVALLAAHVPLVHDAALCLVDRFGKPLRRFNALAPLGAWLSGSQRNAIVSRTRTQVCYVLDSWLRHYASDFLADSELFADSRSCWCSAPTFADSLAVWYRVSPGETALLFHRKYEAPTKKMLKYCGVELDPKSRTLLDYHPVESRGRWRWRGAPTFELVRPSELMSRAWMKGRGQRARARLPEYQAHHQTNSTASAAGWRRN